MRVADGSPRAGVFDAFVADATEFKEHSLAPPLVMVDMDCYEPESKEIDVYVNALYSSNYRFEQLLPMNFRPRLTFHLDPNGIIIWATCLWQQET